MLVSPLRLVLRWGQVTERRVNPLCQIDIINKVSALIECVIKVSVLGQIYFFFLDRSDDSFGIAVLRGLADFGHRDLNLSSL